MNKLLIAIAAFALLVQPAIAGNKHNQFQNWQHNQGHQPPPPPPPDDHTYNYNYNYNYKYKNNNGDWYQNPYLWGSVAGALGQILQPAPQYVMPPQYGAPPPYMGGVPGPECGMIWTQVYIPGKGYVPYQTTVCN